MKRLLAAALVGALALVACALNRPASAQESKSIGRIERFDAALESLLPDNARIEVVAEGFDWSEGPVWVKKGEYLLFSDIPRNHIVKWKEGEGTSIFMEKSGYTGQAPFTGPEPGTNGLMLDREGRLVMCEHGNRRVTMLLDDGTKKVLADRYEGKRLNSPNDLVFHSSGALYFTDPPYGLPLRYEDPARELDWCGVYRLTPGGELTLLTKEMTRPNGIALSPDEKTLYVAQSDPEAAIWKSFPVQEDGTLGAGKLFHDATETVGRMPGLPDGMCVDVKGNVWATGPGGVWIFSPAGKLLGRLYTGERTANCTFGEDGTTLFMTVDMYLCRVRTKTKGLGY